MRKLVTIFILFCFCSISYAQKQKMKQLQNFEKSAIRYGFYLGFHGKGYEMQANDNVEITSGAGFQLGVLADLKLSPFFSVITEPGVITSVNTLTFKGDETTLDEERDMTNTLFHLPLSLKFNTQRINNVRAFVKGGVSYNYNFTANRNNINDGRDVNSTDFKLKENTFMAEFGVGANFYLEYFKFTPSIKAVYSLQNEYIGLGDLAKSSISDLRTRGVFVTLTFQ